MNNAYLQGALLTVNNFQNNIKRQPLIAGVSATNEENFPHHPISCCTGILVLNEDNSMECDHAKSPADSRRTQHAINAAVVIMIFEEAYRKYG